MQNIAKAPTTEEVILLHFAISFCCSSRAVGFYVILFCRTSPISRSFFIRFFSIYLFSDTEKKVPTNQSLTRFYDTNTLYLKGCLFFFFSKKVHLLMYSKHFLKALLLQYNSKMVCTTHFFEIAS